MTSYATYLYIRSVSQRIVSPSILRNKSKSVTKVPLLSRSFSIVNTNTDNKSSIVNKTTTTTPTIPLPQNFAENIAELTNEELSDFSKIPNFMELVHSLPRDRTSVPCNSLIGMVVSEKMSKTVNVEVDRYKIVPKYRKKLRYTKKFLAHDEKEVCKYGDIVIISPCQKISKRKHFRVHEIVKAKVHL